LFLTGCAASRSVLDIAVPEVPNPASLQAVKIVEVVDKRVFVSRPNNPSIPSLQNDEVNDPEIARRRGDSYRACR
jgi:thiamine kinase-like enzyme